MIKVLSYNINGIRAAQKKGLVDWIGQHHFDILCFQEVKADVEQVDLTDFKALGYQYCWHSAEKKGYSGVATFFKEQPVSVSTGMDKKLNAAVYHSEGRILRVNFKDWTLLNCYFPSGTTGDVRQAVKMDFLKDFYDWVMELQRECPHLVVVGDYNIAHTAIDIHDPKGNKNSSGFLPEERAWMSKWFESGFTDAFRKVHPEQVDYSWWSYRANARANNKGWRIDYISVSDILASKVVDVAYFNDAMHSDHCPVIMEIDI
jgi:exodeoxyribonuclease-3